ncbi:MAG: cation:proton antiporter [Bacteroidaceae bacterium]|nr:cation:proton antiporter [Bacteroidaceae bacterium]
MHLIAVLLTSGAPLITDPTWIFFVVLFIILFAPLLFRKLHIPHVIGLIIAGILIGQYGFNLLERDSSFQLFGQVGIYYIMFLAGLELDMGSVEHYGRRGFQFGVITFVIPFILGFLAGKYILGYGVLTSLMLACIFSSHTLVSYPIVGRYGMTRHRVVVISIVATAVATFAALLSLALVVGSLKPDSTIFTWILFSIKCILYGSFVVLAYPRLGRWFLRRYDDNVMQYIFIMALVFLSAALADLVGLEGLLGAFLSGLILNRLIPRTSPLMSRVEFVGNALFIPYFMIGVGMLIDVRILVSDAHTLWVVTVIVITGMFTKWLAAWLMNRFHKYSHDGMNLMFGLTSAHAAGALAIVMIGTDPDVNLMDSAILNGTVMLIFFSCIISSFATSHGARKLALSDTSFEENRGSYHGKCLVTYSQADTVGVMTQFAILIRNPYIPDSLMGLSVAYDDVRGEGDHRQGKAFLEKAQNIAASADVNMTTMSRVSTNIASGILHTMRECDCGEVIVCLTDRETGMPKSSLGTVIDNVIAGSHREVMALRCIVPVGTLRRVIIAVPQKAEYEVGFYKWLEHVCRVGEQLDCHLEFHAHPDTLPYIQGYMRQKHAFLRTEYHEMSLWTQLTSLSNHMDKDDMIIAVTARSGFISYQSSFDSLPLQLYRYFSHTSVMILYPDQWGDPLETVSVFAPSGTVVTRQPHTIGSWFRELFLSDKNR